MALRTTKPAAPYEILSSEAIQAVRDPVALALWVYLRSKPDGWEIREAPLRGHFDVGRDRYRLAMGVLRELGLVRDVRMKNQQGQFVGRRLSVEADLGRAPEIQAHGTEGLPNRPTGKPTDGISGSRPHLSDPDNTVRACSNPPPIVPPLTGKTSQSESPAPKKTRASKSAKEQPEDPPEWINGPAWRLFEEHRESITCPLTNLARRRAWQKLKVLDLAEQGECIDTSIVSGWKGVFPEQIIRQRGRGNDKRNSTQRCNDAFADLDRERGGQDQGRFGDVASHDGDTVSGAVHFGDCGEGRRGRMGIVVDGVAEREES